MKNNAIIAVAICSIILYSNLSANQLDLQEVTQSPRKNYHATVIPLDPSSFDDAKALVLECREPKWMIGLVQNSRVLGVEWSPSEKYIAVFNYGASKECEVSFFGLSKQVKEIRLLQKSPKTKGRSTWEIIKWDEVGRRVLIRNFQEGEDGSDDPAKDLWINLGGEEKETQK